MILLWVSEQSLPISLAEDGCINLKAHAVTVYRSFYWTFGSSLQVLTHLPKSLFWTFHYGPVMQIVYSAVSFFGLSGTW